MEIQSVDDTILIQKVAQRDSQAFQELYDRYAKRVYSLAVYLLRDHQAAEDAVQEGLSEVWRSASSFKSGSVRGWINCIVARKAICMKRREYRKREALSLTEASMKSSTESPPASCAEHSELLAHLRERMDELSQADRTLLGLYYGAGLAQEDISEILSISQRTVSFRLKKIVNGLRVRLADAGIAAAAPLLSAEGFYDALTIGPECPPGLRERVLARIATVSTRTTRVRSRRAAAAAKGSAWVAGLVVVSALGLAVIMGSNGKNHRQELGKTNAASAQLAPPPAVDAASRFPSEGNWDFGAAPPPPEMTLAGPWVWGMSAHLNRRILAPRTGAGHVLALPLSPAASPYLIAIEVKGLEQDWISINALWGSRRTVFPAKAWDLPVARGPLLGEKKTTYHFHFYIWNKWIARYFVEKKLVDRVIEYSSPEPGDTFFLRPQNLALLTISAHPIRQEDFPFDARTLLETVDNLKLNPAHTGSIVECVTPDLYPYEDKP